MCEKWKLLKFKPQKNNGTKFDPTYPSVRYILRTQSSIELYLVGSSAPRCIWNRVFIRSNGCIMHTSTNPAYTQYIIIIIDRPSYTLVDCRAFPVTAARKKIPHHVTSTRYLQVFWQSSEDSPFQTFLSRLSVVSVKWLVPLSDTLIAVTYLLTHAYNYTSCSHTLSSVSGVTTLWRYINQFNFKNQRKFSACGWQKFLSAAD